jgi:hypothetical protein
LNGKDGKDGIDGQTGPTGINGTSVRLVSNFSDLFSESTQTGDSCIFTESDYDADRGEDIEAGDVYEFNGNAWSYKFSIKGPKGGTGDPGKDGEDGKNGTNGVDGLTPFIGENGNWWVGTEDTGVQAEGRAGFTPEIRDGEWYIGGSNTGVKAEGKDGKNPFTEEEVAILNALPEALNITQS